MNYTICNLFLLIFLVFFARASNSQGFLKASGKQVHGEGGDLLSGMGLEDGCFRRDIC